MTCSAYLKLYHIYRPLNIHPRWQHKAYCYIYTMKQSTPYAKFVHQYLPVQCQCALLCIFFLRNFMRCHDFECVAGIALRDSNILSRAHALCFYKSCSQAIICHFYSIRWKIHVFRLYMWTLQLTIKSIMLCFNNDLIQNLYEIIDDILFILDVPKLYRSLLHHFTSSEWPCHITSPEPSSYSPPKKQCGTCKVSLHHLKKHCQKLKLNKASMQKWDSPSQLVGGVKPSTSISKA